MDDLMVSNARPQNAVDVSAEHTAVDENRNPWTVKSRLQVYGNRWIEVTHHQVITPSGSDGIYGVVHFRNLAVGVVPVADNGDTWLVGQFRFTFSAWSWEIPEGGGPFERIRPGFDETALAADTACRELAEETGLRATELLELGRLDLSNSTTDERAVYFAAWGLSQGDTQPDDTEALAVRRLPLSEALAMVEDGRIVDAISVAALQRLKLMYLDGKLPPTLMERVGRGLQ
jgi:8-oxo-dGTP pyrophosphatase MutT (NUDIX family)